MDDAVALVPDDRAAAAAEEVAPGLGGVAGAEAGAEQDGVGVGGVGDGDVVGLIVDFEQVDGGGELEVVVASPARQLTAFEGGQGAGVGAVERVSAGADGASEGEIHPGLKVAPCGVIGVGTGQGGVCQHGFDGIPGGEGGGPFGIEGGEARVLGLQPVAHSGEREWGDVGIPGGGEVADAGFVGQIVEKWVIAGLVGDDLGKAGVDAPLPGGVGEAGVAIEDGGVGRVGAAAGFGFVEEGGDRLAGAVAMIRGVEVGCDVFEKPGKAGGDVSAEFGRVDLAAGGAEFSSGEA